MTEETLHDRCTSLAAAMVSVARIEDVDLQIVCDEIMKILNGD